MYNDDIRRKKWQKGKFGIPFDMVPFRNLKTALLLLLFLYYKFGFKSFFISSSKNGEISSLSNSSIEFINLYSECSL